MTIEQIRSIYEAQPFRPFVIHLADGGTYPFIIAISSCRFPAVEPYWFANLTTP